jgi:ABC-type glycerol-3-phosphate transport system substrate-binding protein
MQSKTTSCGNDAATGHLSLVIGCWSLVVMLILTGCEVLPLTPTPTSAPLTLTPSPTPPKPTLTPTRESQPMIVTLKLWLPEELDPYSEKPGADLLAQQLADFGEAYPDLQVEVTVKRSHGRGGLLDFLRAAREAAPSVLPDLMVLDVGDLEATAGAGLIQPLDELLSPARMTDRFPFATELGTVNGETGEAATMGFVIGADVQHLAYRTTLFDSPPVSWTQVVSPPISFLFPAGGEGRQVNEATLIQYLAAGGELTDQGGNPWLDGDVMAHVLTFYSDCIGTAAISPTVVLGIMDADQAWEQFKAEEGEVAVVRAGRYWLEADETTAAASVPTYDGHPFGIVRGKWAIAMVADDPERQAMAMLLLDWLIAPDHSAQWTQAAGYLPGMYGALRLWDISNADRIALRSLMEVAILPPPLEIMTSVGPVMQGALEAVLRGQATPEEASAAAVESLEK